MKNLVIFIVIFTLITSFSISPSSACSCYRSQDIPESYVRNPILQIKVSEVKEFINKKPIDNGEDYIRYNTQEIIKYDTVKIISKGGYELETSQYYGDSVRYNEALVFNTKIKIVKEIILTEDSEKAVCSACSGYSNPYSYLKTDIQVGKEYLIFIYYSESDHTYKIQGILEVIDQRLFNQFYDIVPNSWISSVYNKIYYSIENDLYFDVEGFGKDFPEGFTQILRDLKRLEEKRNNEKSIEEEQVQQENNQSHKAEANNETNNSLVNAFKWLGVGVLIVLLIPAIIFLGKRFKK